MMTLIRIPASVDADVVVAGGGPAGASAAARLAAGGMRVIVLDQRAFPRDKVCGDFVGPAALVELEALGVNARADYLATNIIRRAALFLDGRELIRRPLPEVQALPSYGRCIPRLMFDRWVLDTARGAGAAVIEGARVTGFDVTADGVTVHAQQGGERLRLRARLLIGADGSSSVVARLLRGAAPAGENRIIAVRAYYEGVEGPEDRADLYFSAASFPGYYWLFPTGAGEANVGVGMVLETLPPTADHLRELLLDLFARDPALTRRLRRATLRGKVVGWPLTTYDARLPLVSDRVLLVGDAAGFINPLNGEGIQYALISGRWAAETALDCRAEDDYTAGRLAAYAERAERELRFDMAFAAFIVQLIRNRHLNGVWLEALKVISARARIDEQYALITGGILAGLSPAHDALSVKVLGRTLDQALYSAVLGVAMDVLQGPRHLTRRAAEVAHAGAAVTATLLADPVALAGWIIGVARQGSELAGQIGGQLLDSGASPPSPPPLFAASARVRLPMDA
jgi:menaquinone-9 beta-reductase